MSQLLYSTLVCEQFLMEMQKNSLDFYLININQKCIFHTIIHNITPTTLKSIRPYQPTKY